MKSARRPRLEGVPRAGEVVRLGFCTAILSLFAALELSGCGRVIDYARVIEANRLHDQGDYQAAVGAYRRVNPAVFPATLDYDLANAYARLGEYEVAAKLYSAAGREGDRALAADSLYNQGVAYFERGRFQDSWKAFRSALSGAEASGAFARAARRNLELAWRAWKKRDQGQSLSPGSRGSPGDEEGALRLLRSLETGRWKPGKTAPAPSPAPDY